MNDFTKKLIGYVVAVGYITLLVMAFASAVKLLWMFLTWGL